MAENITGTKNIAKKWPLLFWTGAVFCFLILPVFLLDVGIESYINTRNKIEEGEAYKKLGLNLENLLQYGDGLHYFHSLLKKLFDIAEEQEKPVNYLEAAIPHLKERNPDAFSFIVWNNETNSLVEHLTDEKGHKYVLKTLKEVFTEVFEQNAISYPVKPDKLDVVSKKINIVRSYIGNFLVADALSHPLLRANLGKIIPVSADRSKAYFWFQAGKKLTMMVTINKKALDSLTYVEKLVNGLNKNTSDDIRFGMIDLLHDREVIPEADESRAAELRLSLIKYDNYSSQKLSTNNFLMLIKIMNPFTRAFCYIPKESVFKNQGLLKQSIWIATAVILVFFIGLWLLYKYTDTRFSMRWKLSLLFLYANGLPLLALSFIGYDYMEQNRGIQLQEAYDNISSMINDFDTKFGLIKREYASRLNGIVDAIKLNYDDKEATKPLYEKLLGSLDGTEYTDFAVVSIDGKIIISGKDLINASSLRDIAIGIMKFANNNKFSPLAIFSVDGNKDSNSLDSAYKGHVFFNTVISKFGKITYEVVMDTGNYYYFNLIGNIANRDFRELVAISWPVHQLQENYVKNNIKKLNENNQNIKCIAFSEKYGNIFPDEYKATTDLLGRFRQIINLNSIGFEEMNINNKSYVAFGSVGMELDKIAMLGYYPLDIINAKINSIRYKLIAFVVTSLLLTLGISWFLSTYFLSPIKDLQAGIEAMGRQEFTYRLPIKSADEFGELNGVFNNALESLEDLAVATTVQENLFPLQPLEQNKAFVWGKSVTMTRLGGDYFDFFPLSDNEIGVLMGDVAGHGIPAGFLMAMAKASVMLSGDEKKSPAKLMSTVHKVFHHVKSRKIKRMMTCVYFYINTETGAYKVVNAGHCYPVIVNRNAEPKFLEMIGSPLGITKKARYTDVDGQLEDGSYLLLYTDGMLEAHNAEGESFGLERFLELVSKSYSLDPEEYYKNIFAGYKAWSPMADDDITMVLVKYGFEKEIKA